MATQLVFCVRQGLGIVLAKQLGAASCSIERATVKERFFYWQLLQSDVVKRMELNNMHSNAPAFKLPISQLIWPGDLTPS